MKRGFPTESSPSPFREEEDEYYKVIRLKTGESILCSMNRNVTSSQSDSHMTLRWPVQAILSKQMTKDENVVGEMFTLRPWVGLSNSEEFIIPADIVLTVGDMKTHLKKQYIEYLNETQLAERIIQKEEEDEKMNRAIYHLLSQVNGGRKVHIINIEDDDE